MKTFIFWATLPLWLTSVVIGLSFAGLAIVFLGSADSFLKWSNR